MTEFEALSVGVFLGAVVSAFSGFAFSAVAGAVLLHAYDPLTAIPVMMACSIVSQAVTLAALRKSISFGSALHLLSGGAAGVALATQVLPRLNAATLKLTFGVFLVGYSVYAILRSKRQEQRATSPLSELTTGALGGLVGVFTAMPGAIPSLWCEFRGLSKEEQRGLVQPFILVMQVFALILLSLTGGIPSVVPFHVLMALPVLLLGIAVGLFAFRSVDDRIFRVAVLALLIVSGLSLLR